MDEKTNPDSYLTAAIYGSFEQDPLDDLEIPPNPADEFIKASANEFRLFGPSPIDPSWNEPVGLLEKREREPEEFSSDGIVTEKNGSQVWHYTVNGGKIVHMKVEDEDVPGGVLHFDGDGNEIAA